MSISSVRSGTSPRQAIRSHILALEYLLADGASAAFNVGTGAGHSVKEVLRAVEAATGKPVPHVVGPRRDGDPPALVADSQKIRRALGWEPRYTDLREIAETAWRFARKKQDFRDA